MINSFTYHYHDILLPLGVEKVGKKRQKLIITSRQLLAQSSLQPPVSFDARPISQPYLCFLVTWTTSCSLNFHFPSVEAGPASGHQTSCSRPSLPRKPAGSRRVLAGAAERQRTRPALPASRPPAPSFYRQLFSSLVQASRPPAQL